MLSRIDIIEKRCACNPLFGVPPRQGPVDGRGPAADETVPAAKPSRASATVWNRRERQEPKRAGSLAVRRKRPARPDDRCHTAGQDVRGAGWDTSTLTAFVQVLMAVVDRAHGTVRD